MSWLSDTLFCDKCASKATLINSLFNAATFSGSLLLLYGIVVPDVLRLIGDTTPYLIVAALAGVLFSIHSLKPAKFVWPTQKFRQKAASEEGAE
ncbi:hypothetical protein ACM64Y_00500 [Novispirillum sp. DQ9]|uniref:hypothetical protein n=1 Tax=Novispirillum sp. DQ9 TaxID=3398612 RepID=UPI003C7AA649